MHKTHRSTLPSLRTLLSISLVVGFVFFAYAPQARAATRLQACESLARSQEIQACKDKLNREAFELCIGKPDPGPCADNYRNSAETADADESNGEPSVGGAGQRARSTCTDINDCPLIKNYIVPLINTLTGAVGVAVVIMIAWGGIKYTSSRDNPQETAAAKKHIINALMGLIAYIFMVAILNWLVPGGVF